MERQQESPRLRGGMDVPVAPGLGHSAAAWRAVQAHPCVMPLPLVDRSSPDPFRTVRMEPPVRLTAPSMTWIPRERRYAMTSGNGTDVIKHGSAELGVGLSAFGSNSLPLLVGTPRASRVAPTPVEGIVSVRATCFLGTGTHEERRREGRRGGGRSDAVSRVRDLNVRVTDRC